MSAVRSFDPIADRSARLLILGSMPGVKSLAAQQYYAHPRNAFWPIMGELFGFSAGLPYARRIAALKKSRVALWDVLRACERAGSLDSAIARGTCTPNDLPAFLERHPHISMVGFNGGEAERIFTRAVLPRLAAGGLTFVRLPSTSPAHTLPLATKAALWRKLLAQSN
ncbi:MAG: DNA-deoxyinosine glycosylase [Steroidobacteraceae bacterium]